MLASDANRGMSQAAQALEGCAPSAARDGPLRCSAPELECSGRQGALVGCGAPVKTNRRGSCWLQVQSCHHVCVQPQYWRLLQFLSIILLPGVLRLSLVGGLQGAAPRILPLHHSLSCPHALGASCHACFGTMACQAISVSHCWHALVFLALVARAPCRGTVALLHSCTMLHTSAAIWMPAAAQPAHTPRFSDAACCWVHAVECVARARGCQLSAVWP
jgi:hypothetical protein